MSLAEIKTALIAAHRAHDWERAKELSQFKRLARRVVYCVDCGVRIQRGARCLMHRNIHQYYQRSLPQTILQGCNK